MLNSIDNHKINYLLSLTMTRHRLNMANVITSPTKTPAMIIPTRSWQKIGSKLKSHRSNVHGNLLQLCSNRGIKQFI